MRCVLEVTKLSIVCDRIADRRALLADGAAPDVLEVPGNVQRTDPNISREINQIGQEIKRRL
jgi:hypothetical protein